MNQMTLAGNLGMDPEVRFTSSGQKVTTLRVATRMRKDETLWWKVTIWGEQFDKMMPWLKKGKPVIVVGELNKPEIFTDREGKPQVSMSVTALNVQFSPFNRPEEGGERQASNAPAQHEPEMAFAGATTQSHADTFGGGSSFGQGKSSSILDDEVPF